MIIPNMNTFIQNTNNTNMNIFMQNNNNTKYEYIYTKQW